MNNIKEISPAAALSMIQNGTLLVDVREPDEVEQKSFDVPNILLIPFSGFEKRFKEIPADRQVIIGCRSGHRSMMAIRFLMKQGYNNAVNLQHGIICWEKDGLPIKKELRQKKEPWLLQQFRKMS
jgi:rhodanese-related sulfurtransferase